MLNSTIMITGPAEGVLKVNLICQDSKIFYAEYLDLKELQEKTFDAALKLKDIGECYIEAEVNSTNSKTASFTISNNIEINASLNKESFYPGEELEISGTLTKDNGEGVNGTLGIYLDNELLKEINLSGQSFDVKVDLPKELSSYDYNIELKVQDSEK